MKSKFLQNKTQMMMMLLAFLTLLTMQKLVAQPCATWVYGLTGTGDIRKVSLAAGTLGIAGPKLNTASTGLNAPDYANGLGYANGKLYYFERNNLNPNQEFVVWDTLLNTVTILADCPSTTIINLGAVASHGLGYYCIDALGVLYYYRNASNMWTMVCNNIKTSTGVLLKDIIAPSGYISASERIYGDIAFDGSGNMWLTISGPNDFGIYKIPANVPTNNVLNLTMYQMLAPTTPTPGLQSIGGTAFNSTGQLLISTNSPDDKLYRVNNNYSVTFLGQMTSAAIGTDLAACSLPMFVLSTSWLDFAVKSENENAEIKFTVDGSKDNRGYYIEHSTDGKQWEEIAYIADRKAANSIQTYTYSHKSILSGKHEYRIVSAEITGRKTYSEERAININSGAKISLYPNPAANNLQLVLPAGNSVNSEMTIFDHAGRQLLNSKLKAGTNNINIQSLKAGAYFVRVTLEGGEVINQRFIKNIL